MSRSLKLLVMKRGTDRRPWEYKWRGGHTLGSPLKHLNSEGNKQLVFDVEVGGEREGGQAWRSGLLERQAGWPGMAWGQGQAGWNGLGVWAVHQKAVWWAWGSWPSVMAATSAFTAGKLWHWWQGGCGTGSRHPGRQLWCLPPSCASCWTWVCLWSLSSPSS